MGVICFSPIKLPFAFKFIITCCVLLRFPQIAGVRTLHSWNAWCKWTLFTSPAQPSCFLCQKTDCPSFSRFMGVCGKVFWQKQETLVLKLVPKAADVWDVQNNLAESGICNARITSVPLRELTNKHAACGRTAILMRDESPGVGEGGAGGGGAAGEGNIAPCLG